VDTCLVTVSPSAHVASIELAGRKTGPRYTVTAEVVVHDQGHDGIGRATVEATWSVNGQVVLTQEERTSGRGVARFRYRSELLASGDVVTLTVTGVSAPGHVYLPELNEESSDQTAMP